MSANYSKPVALGDDVYTVADFREHVRDAHFIDYDGYGHPVKLGKCDPNIDIMPSRVRRFPVEAIPDDATHIVWYNR